MELIGIDTIKQPETRLVIEYILSEEFGEHIQAFYEKKEAELTPGT